jgi:hypothetical protein
MTTALIYLCLDWMTAQFSLFSLNTTFDRARPADCWGTPGECYVVQTFEHELVGIAAPSRH